MARVWPVVATLARVVLRDQRRLQGIASNNIFWILFLLQGSGAFLFVLIALVALFPLCADPFRKIPPERARLWPLSPADLRLVRIASLAVSPAAWIAAAAIVITGRPQFLLIALLLAAFAIPFPRAPLFRSIPGFLGELVRKNIRELLSLLDPYIAFLLAAAAIAYRLARPSQVPPEALTAMSLMVVVVLSTCAQNLFALDAGPGLDRYRLLPIPGWRVLMAKHAALALIAVPLTLPLDPIAAAAGLLVSLGVGNHMAVTNPRLQPRGGITAGSLFPGLVQVVAVVTAGLHATRSDPDNTLWILAPCAAFYLASTLLYGFRLDRRSS
ncbi:MAG: hypothetical protein R2762_22305 [Bryobacteraceae bacterium]